MYDTTHYRPHIFCTFNHSLLMSVNFNCALTSCMFSYLCGLDERIIAIYWEYFIAEQFILRTVRNRLKCKYIGLYMRSRVAPIKYYIYYLWFKHRQCNGIERIVFLLIFIDRIVWELNGNKLQFNLCRPDICKSVYRDC